MKRHLQLASKESVLGLPARRAFPSTEGNRSGTQEALPGIQVMETGGNLASLKAFKLFI